MEVATRCSKSVRAVVFGAFAATLLAPDPAIAGNGRVVEDGSLGLIELEVYNDPFSGASMAEVRAAFSEASRILWDATDGHFRIGTVTFVPYGIAVGADIEVVRPVAVPELQMGAIETFFVVDGKDIAPTSRQEE